jgi:hypothetical protein
VGWVQSDSGEPSRRQTSMKKWQGGSS